MFKKILLSLVACNFISIFASSPATSPETSSERRSPVISITTSAARKQSAPEFSFHEKGCPCCCAPKRNGISPVFSRNTTTGELKKADLKPLNN